MGAARKNDAEDKIIQMAGKQKKQTTKTGTKPASNPESREQQLVNYAVNLAEKQLIEGTASSAVITHFLKIASSRESLEREILQKQAELIKAKASSLTKDRDVENLAKQAIEAMKNYNSGTT